MKAREEEVRKFKTTDRKGKEVEEEYTPYEATQRMREMERQIRKNRSVAKHFKDGGLDGDCKLIKQKITKQRKEYERFCEAMEMKPDWNRIYMDSLGKI